MLKKNQCWRCDTICSAPNAKIHCNDCEVAYYCSKQCKDSDNFRHQVDCQTAKLKRKCSGCGKEKVGLKACGSCSQEWYCNRECQEKSWPTHKALCHQVTREINKLAEQIKQRLTWMMPGVKDLYYWGNVPATDLINLPLNEGCDYSKPLSVLVCGVGDPRDVMLSLSQLPQSYQEELTFVLNDICACTLARTVLLLYLLFKGGTQVASSVVQIWYSLRLSEEDYQLMILTLNELIASPSLEDVTGGAMKMDLDQFQRIAEVWKTWLRLNSRREGWITAIRSSRIKQEDDAKGIDMYLRAIPEEHRESMSAWYENGILLPKGSRKVLDRENVSLTGSDFPLSGNKGNFTYMIPTCVTPFSGWDYKEVNQWGHSASVLKMYRKYVGHVLKECALRLATGKVKFYFLLCNCMEISPFLPSNRKYDRVTTSNIADYVALTNLLDKFKPHLNRDNPSSVIITQFQNWFCFTGLLEKAMERASALPPHDSFRQKIFEDTRNRAISESTGYQAFMDYDDYSFEFIQFLRASLLIPDTTGERNQRRRTWKSLAHHKDLVARNFLRCQNQVFPVKWKLNCRKVTMMTGFGRNVEWIFQTK